MSRAKTPVDEKEVYNLAKVGATNKEIGDCVGIDESRVRRRFADLLLKARGNNKIRLRQLQYAQAEEGNVTMLIWLGKNMLGQSDKTEQVIDNREPLKIIVGSEKTKKLIDKLGK